MHQYANLLPLSKLRFNKAFSKTMSFWFVMISILALTLVLTFRLNLSGEKDYMDEEAQHPLRAVTWY